MKAHVAIVGEFDPVNPTHLATNKAIEHSARSLNESPEIRCLPTAIAERADLSAFDGFWIAPGSPYKSLSGALRVIRYAREKKVPLFGSRSVEERNGSQMHFAGWSQPLENYMAHLERWSRIPLFLWLKARPLPL
jgi:hypothetical protein